MLRGAREADREEGLGRQRRRDSLPARALVLWQRCPSSWSSGAHCVAGLLGLTFLLVFPSKLGEKVV